MFDFQRYMRFLPKLIFKIFWVSCKIWVWGKNPTDTAEPWYPHYNITVRSHSCDECMKSSELIFCHMLLPIWWLIEQVCSLIIECQAYQFVPSTSISRQFVSTPWKILQLIHVPLSWNDDHPSDDSRLCIVAVFFARSQYLSTHFLNLSFHIRRTTLPSLREAFPTLVIFSVAPAEFRDSYILACSSIMTSFGLHSRRVHPKYSIKKWSWFVQIKCFHHFLPHGSHILHLSSHVIHANQQE